MVAKIAERERRKPVALSETAYLASSRSGVVPCFGRTRWTNLEGFLFPATYDFLRKTTSRQLVADQLAAFCDEWRKVDMSYARSKNLTPYDVLTIASMIEKEAAVPSERPLMAAVIILTIMIAPRTTSIDSRRARFDVALAPGTLAGACAASPGNRPLTPSAEALSI